MPPEDVERNQLQAEIDRLRGPMLRKRVWVALWAKVGATTPDALSPILPEHLRFMLDLEERGILMMSGPLFEADGGASIHGLSVLRADSYAAAAAILDREPYVLRGMRSYQLWAWEICEGRLDIGVRLGTGRFDVG